MIDLYLTCKALHLISMVAWFAGLFYLPRLFVYHVERPEAAAMFQVMEHKLARFIMLPAAVSTALFGMAMVLISPEVMQMGWLHAKLGLVMLLVAYHISLEVHRLNLAAGRNRKSGRFFRLYNEIPTFLLIAIIFLAVLKPF
jgi:putative membrane protein